MIFGQNYFDVLTSRIGGAGGIWNRQGLSNVNSKSKAGGARGSSRISGANNSYYGLSANTIKAMNNAYNTTANKSYMADTNVADGAVKVENAGRKLSYGDIYHEKNTEELLKTVKNFVDGYNEVSTNARNTTSTTVRNRAGWMREDARGNASELRKIGIGFNSKTGELSVDEDAFKGANKDDIKKTFAGAGSFGQRMRNNASLTSQAAVTASRFSVNTGVYGSNGRYGTNNLLGGYGGYSSLLSSMFSSWF
jgi:flagellar capping protein FliD